MSDATIVYLIIGAVVVLFISNRVPVEIVALGSALALYFTDVLEAEQVLAGFGDPTVIFIASLFVVSEAMEASGITAWASQQLMARGGSNPSRLLIMMMVLVALMSALITPNGAVAALVPVVVVLAMRVGSSPSKMLLPLSFASFSGALLTLSGSPVNVLVHEASRDAGGGGFNYFEFAIVGVPLMIGTIAITAVLGPRLLPSRQPRTMPRDFSQHARTLLTQYAREVPIYRLRIAAGSPLIGVEHAAIDVSEYAGLRVVGAQSTPGVGVVVGAPPLAQEDVLVMSGPAKEVERFAREQGLRVSRVAVPAGSGSDLYSKESGVAEVVIPPRSEAIGQTVFPGLVTESGDLVVLAVQRAGDDRPGKTELAAGDVLLLAGSWDALDTTLDDGAMMVVDSPADIRRQIVPLGGKAKITLVILGAMVIMLATGWVPPSIAALVAAVAILVTGVVSTQQAYRAIGWTVIVLIGAMIPLSTAMTQTGAADQIADVIVNIVGDGSPYVLIIALFILVALMGQLISNTATALIVIPVAISAATELDVNVQPVLMSMTIAASASFLTPIATTPNLMVFEPGGYRFDDYWKFGLPLMLLYFVVAILVVPLVWQF